MYRFSLAAITFLALSFAACEQGTEANTASEAKDSSTLTTPPAEPTSSLSAANTSKMMDMLGNYYEVKNALVKTDAATADKAASRLMSSAEMLDHDLQADTAHYSRLHPFFESIMNSAEGITNLKDETCDKKRVEFEKTSVAMYALLSNVNLQGGKVYQQYCPMAFNDKGAYWLSSEEEIMNPYLPKKMLHCGEVKDTL